MNLAVVFLSVLLIIVLYFFYTNYYSKLAKSKIIHLSDNNAPILLTDLMSNPSSLRFSYSFWINVNSLIFNKPDTNKSLMNDPGTINLFYVTLNNASVNTDNGGIIFQLNLDSQANLMANIITTGSDSKKVNNKITILKNFPIQSWRYVAISFDNSTMDVYLDGKIVLSQQLKNSSGKYTYPSPTEQSSIKGAQLAWSQGADVYFNKLQILPNPMDPMTAWANYSRGSGATSGSNYGMTASITKDSQIQNTYTLF